MFRKFASVIIGLTLALTVNSTFASPIDPERPEAPACTNCPSLFENARLVSYEDGSSAVEATINGQAIVIYRYEALQGDGAVTVNNDGTLTFQDGTTVSYGVIVRGNVDREDAEREVFVSNPENTKPLNKPAQFNGR